MQYPLSTGQAADILGTTEPKLSEHGLIEDLRDRLEVLEWFDRGRP